MAESENSVECVCKSDESFYDKFCDEASPVKVNFVDISTAYYEIKDGIVHTPCTKSKISELFGMDLYFKKEYLQFTGSFKERGARYTLLKLSKAEQERGVIAASAGNHALALSYHGKLLRVPVTVVMPIVAPLMKVSACKQYGANVIVTGQDIGDAKKHAMHLAKINDLLYINGYDHPDILAGQGTIGIEIIEQVNNFDACIIPVGGGGLIAGTSVAIKSIKPDVKIYGVESERCASFSSALEAGHPVYTPTLPSLADVMCMSRNNLWLNYNWLLSYLLLIAVVGSAGRFIAGLAVPTVGINAFHTAKGYIDKMVTVKEGIKKNWYQTIDGIIVMFGLCEDVAYGRHREEYVALSILRLIEQEKAVVEGAGAIGLAAIMQNLFPELLGKRVVVILCGGNIDTTALGRVLERGLAAEGRLIRFVVTVTDRPGGIADLTKFLSQESVSIKDIQHERAWLKSDVFSVQVKCVVETRDMLHSMELREKLRVKYDRLLWGPEHSDMIDLL